MIASHISSQMIRDALELTNYDYNDNIKFKREPIHDGRRRRFTLTVIDSKLPGARRSANGRRIRAACWHVHKDFMIHLFQIAPEGRLDTAVIKYFGQKDFRHSYPQTGDQNIGSEAHPLLAKDACACSEATA